MEIKPLAYNNCPVCEKIIIDKSKHINGGKPLFVKMNDERVYEFSICEECFNKLDKETISKIISRQIVNWGIDLDKQLQWFYQKAVHLEAEQWSDKNEFKLESDGLD